MILVVMTLVVELTADNKYDYAYTIDGGIDIIDDDVLMFILSF